MITPVRKPNISQPHFTPLTTPLISIGHRIRRTNSLQLDASSLDAELCTIHQETLRRWLDAIDVEGLFYQLDQALEQSFSAGVLEPQESYQGPAVVSALRFRDEVESIVVASERWCSLMPQEFEIHNQVASIRAEMRILDQNSRVRVRSLTFLNYERKRERDRLNPEYQNQAWWYTARAECDDLITMLSGQSLADETHINSCPDCKRDQAHISLVYTPPKQHLNSDDLWNYEFGTLNSHEKTRIDQHIKTCSDCRYALQVSQEVEDAVCNS